MIAETSPDELEQSANDRLVRRGVEQLGEPPGHGSAPGIVDPLLVVRGLVPVGDDQVRGRAATGGPEQNGVSTTSELPGPGQNALLLEETFERIALAGGRTEGQHTADYLPSPAALRSSSAEMLTAPTSPVMCAQHIARFTSCA